MSVSLVYHDPTVPSQFIERYKLAYLMQFFVQHKQRFKFPRVRLQDLFKLLENQDYRPLAYLVVQILRFLKIPNATISSVDKALDTFSNEKRTCTRVNIHQLRAGRQIFKLNAENKAKLLENLIETVYDELPDFNFAPNGFNGGNSSNSTNNHSFCGGSKSFSDIKQEETADDSMNELAIKAGSDSKGSSYVYLDDLRLYREKPQSSLSAQWDVVVGPTIDQWRTFIKSLGHVDEEGDLRAFLNDHLLEVVSTSLDSGELSQENPELFVANLLQREQSELNGSADYCINGSIQKALPSCSGNIYEIQDSGGGGNTSNVPASQNNNTNNNNNTTNNNNSTNNGIDSSNNVLPVKQEMTDNQDSFSGSLYVNSNVVNQNQQLIPRSSSYPGSQAHMPSPLYGSVSSPAQSAHGAPSTPSGENNQIKTSPRITSCQSREQKIDSSNMPMSYPQPHQNIYHPSMHPIQHMPDAMVGNQLRYPNQHRFPYPANTPMVMISGGPNPALGAPGQAMVFTTQMANDAAVEISRQRTTLYQFHNNHPAVIEFIQHQCNSNRLIQKPYEQLTQKQLENRKNKMAKLEQIQSTLSKTKSQTATSSSNSSQTSTSSTTTTTSSTAPTLPDLNSRPLSSNQMPTSAAIAMSSAIGCESSAGIETANQDMNHINTLSSINSNSTAMLTDNGSTPMHSTLSGQCHPFPMDQQQQMSGQYHLNSNQQMTSSELQAFMMGGDSNNPPCSEAAQRQWELLRMEYMREKQAHDVMSNRFPTGDMVQYANGSGPGNPGMIPNNLPVVSNMIPGHRPNLIRQSFPPHAVPMEPSPGVMYPATAGVKRPYQLIGAPPPPGYHSHPMYHQHHHESLNNQRAILMQQQQQQQQQARCPQICDPSWSMVHPNYPHMPSHHHPMHQNFTNMYPHHRGPTPPAALAASNGPMPTGQNVSSNSSTTTTTSTSSKSKSKKRKSNAKTSVASSTVSTTTSTITTSVSGSSNTSQPNIANDMKPHLSQMNTIALSDQQRFLTPMMNSLGPHDENPMMNRNLSNFPDHVINGNMPHRLPAPETQIMSNPTQIKNELMSPNKASFSPLSDIKSSGSLSSSNHPSSASVSGNGTFSNNQSLQNTAYCSSSISSPSQNLTSASLASLARLSSQMSGGGDSPPFNSLQLQSTSHSSSSSSSNVNLSKSNSANQLHSVSSQQIQDNQIGIHHTSQQPSMPPYHSSYPVYRHPSNIHVQQQQQQTQPHNNTNNNNNNNNNTNNNSNNNSMIQQHQKSMPQQMINPQSNNFLTNHIQPNQIPQPQHQFPGNHEIVFSQYQSYPNQQMPINTTNNGSTQGISATNNAGGMIPGVSVQAGPQTPSIMVNNTFVNAQLNVQQMNYQHLAAPNVNAQMQIQQQHQIAQPASSMNMDASKHQSDMSGINNAPSSISNNQPNDNILNNQSNMAASNINAPPASSGGFVNSSVVQIQSKTPHTIQYLPAEPIPASVPGIGNSGITNPNQSEMSFTSGKYANITVPALELDELLSSQNKQMMFHPNHEMSTGMLGNPHSNNMMMMGQQQVESQQFRIQQHQQQLRLRAAVPGQGMPPGTMIMRQSQSQQPQQQQQQQLVLQQSFSGSGSTILDQQMKQQQIQRLMMINNNQICQQQQQQQQMIMSGQLPQSAHSHYISLEAANQDQQHLYHQQQFIAIQQQQQQIRQQSQAHH